MNRRLYVETSALLRVLLDGDEALRPVLSGEGLFTSALTFVEGARAVSRARREQRLDAREAREAERQLAAEFGATRRRWDSRWSPRSKFRFPFDYRDTVTNQRG